MSWGEVDQALAERFSRDIDRLHPRGQRIGLAVSGGPDSLALLILAHEVRPNAIEVATVDHGLRVESASEARSVAELCAAKGILHSTLRPAWTMPPQSAVQEKARAARYAALGAWATERSLPSIATAHHREDQAETFLMRLARGSGVTGLAAMRTSSQVPGCCGTSLLRPLLSWSKEQLVQVCASAGLRAADDPSNRDTSFERVRVREALETAPWLDADAIGRSAARLQSADEALDWAAQIEWSHVSRIGDSGFSYSPMAPEEIRRRVVGRILHQLGHEGSAAPRGRDLDRLMATLFEGGTATLRGVRCSGGAAWLFVPAPVRKPVRRRTR